MKTSAPFEIRIVKVRWNSKKEARDVEVAWSPTLLVEDGQGGYTADITAYPELSFRRPGQIGILAPELTSPPVLVLGGGESQQELYSVSASDGRTWWIELGKWKTLKGGDGYHDAPICRHAGEAHLRVGAVDLRLRVSMPGFNEQEFETLLDEFRFGLWQLILEPMSPVTISVRQPDLGVSEAFLEAIRNHIRHVERALAKPHLELRERSEQQPLTKVRPMARTFQELALRGAPRWITGRGHAASYDTPENRLLLTMTVTLNRLLQSCFQLACERANDFGRQADIAEAHAKTLNGFVKVAPEKLDQELRELQSHARVLEEACGKLLIKREQDENLHEIVIKVKKQTQRDTEQNLKDAKSDEFGFRSDIISVAGEQRNSETLRLVFDRELKDAVVCVFSAQETYTLKGRFEKIDEKDTAQGKWISAKVGKLCQINSSLEEKIASEMKYLRGEQLRLAESGYWYKLPSSAAREQMKDRQAQELKAKRSRSDKEHWVKKAKTLKLLLSQTGKLIERAKCLNISARQGLTISASMTYVQNPDYRGALAAFRVALNEANLDVSKIDQLFRLDKIGILDMPRVYERWCLLRMVRVLREQHGFIPTGAYQDDLFKGLADQWGLKGSDEAIRIFFEGTHLNRDVLLEYEPVLPSGRRPDFVVTVLSRHQQSRRNDADFDCVSLSSRAIDQRVYDSGYFDQDPQDPGPFSSACFEQERLNSAPTDQVLISDHSIHQKKLILDAKCKQFVPIASDQEGTDLDSELEELIARRRYDENGSNRVFVLHPGFDADSAQESERYCRYGGGHFTSNPDSRPDWDKGSPDHRHGAVLLRPGVTDPLSRLITMHLYLNWENTAGYYDAIPPRYQPFCPACGEARTTETPPPGADSVKKRGKALARWCAADRCGHLIIRNYCWNCGTHLWKLGGYWSFHETRALNPYDIKCPHCGNYLIIIRNAPEQYIGRETG